MIWINQMFWLGILLGAFGLPVVLLLWLFIAWLWSGLMGRRTYQDAINAEQIRDINHALRRAGLSVGCESYGVELLAEWCQANGVRYNLLKGRFVQSPKGAK